MPENKKLFLLDAMALIYRAFFALNRNPRINSKGMNTSAALGFANTLVDLIKSENPTHIGIAIDTKAPTVRHEEFVEYKANRERMPEDLASNIPYIEALIDAFNIPLLSVDGYEADDVIGTLAKKAEKEGFTVYMMTPDKDFGQLVSENIYMYKPARMGNKPEILGPPEVCSKYGIERPEQLIDILGLWGDASDNIPGVPGIGEKTASKLIAQYGSVEELLKNSHELKGKQKENVENFSDQAVMSKMLATIILDVPIGFDEKQLEIQDPKRKELKEIFDELEFRTLAKRVFTDLSVQDAEKGAAAQTDLFSSVDENIETIANIATIETIEHSYKLVRTEEEIDSLVAELSQQTSFCFDTETTGLEIHDAELIGIAFSWKKTEACFLMLPTERDAIIDTLEAFRPIFENEASMKIGQNCKYDISILNNYGMAVKGKIFDTMLAHYLLEPDMRHNMDVLAETYLNYKPVSIETLIGKKGKGQSSMRMVDPEALKEYACEDADITLQLKEVFEPKLSEANLSKLFNEIELPLVQVLSSMETEGVKLDIPSLKKYSEDLATDVEAIEKAIYEDAGGTFNISSPKQLGEILFEKLVITDKPKLTKTKQYATGEDILTRLVNKHPIISKILDYRSLTKLKSTYVDTLPALVNHKTGRIHTSYNQAVAATGRLSSNNPNLQNIPIRTERGREIRKAFVPRSEEYTLLAADYSQIELRIIAELSEDPAMIDAFVNGHDIHTATAAKVYATPFEEVTKEQRRNAKTVNFGIVYGISAFGLSERLNIPRREASDIIKQYFAEYPGVKAYMDKSIAFARENGYVETMMGRRRYLRDINSANATVRGFAERNAINAPIQGSSADMIKIAMINIYNEFRKHDFQSKMILQVHDELVFDAHKSEIETIKPIIEEKMKTAFSMTVPILIDMNTGENWLEAH